METGDPSERVQRQELTELAEILGDSLTRGLVDGLRQSELAEGLMALIGKLHQRVVALEEGGGLLDRIESLEADLARLKGGAAEPIPEPPPPPRAASAPAVPPANMPRSTSVSSVPFGLSASPARRTTTTRRPRTRGGVRPTVVYRTDPRAGQKARSSDGDADDQAVASKTCGEPGCHLPVEEDGLCSLHLDRAKARAEGNVTLADAFPMPPLPPPKKSSGKKKDGGTKGVFAILYEEKGRRTLAGMINQMKFDRADLVARLNKQFEGLPGVPLDEEDVLRAVHYHKLGDSMRQKEGEIVCRHLTKQRGSMVKAAQKMKIEPEQFRERIEELELNDEVSRIRNQFREEVLEKSSFAARLDLALTREKYLKDLDIEQDVDRSLRGEIQVQLDKLAAEVPESGAEDAICQALGLDAQRFRRMIRRYELEDQMLQLGVEPLQGEDD